ncbi:MAG TPA: hypothetical protein VFA61_00260 [Candidatus Udaeobacter sp.]|nr:hypothetical protein [Candidatus Udaeobacter sp.]
MAEDVEKVNPALVVRDKLTEQEKRIEALASDLQKVSEKIEATKPAPQVADNNP